MKDCVKSTKEKISQIESSIHALSNTVPSDFKVTFNYKGRKSIDIANEVISRLTSDSSVVFDPFFGSGSFILAAAKTKVKEIIGTELDQYPYFAFQALVRKINFEKLEMHFQSIKKAVYDKVMSLYQTECCNSINYISKLFFDPDNGVDGLFNPAPHREIQNNENIKLVATCPYCGKKSKRFDEKDLQKLKSLEAYDTSRFPNIDYIENSRINITKAAGANKYDRIFVKRSKIALLLIQDAINSIPACDERDLLENALVSALSLARIAMYGSATDILYHVVKEKAQETNVWLLFEEKYRNFVKFKKAHPEFQIDKNNSRIKLFRDDYSAFINAHPEVKADVIYTDFPYTDQVPYLERNQLYRIWLETFYDKKAFSLTPQMLNEEIVLTNAPSRPNKNTIESYCSDIDKMFAQLSKIIRPDGLAVFTLNLGKEKYFKVYLEIINLARKNGFEFVHSTALIKNDPTLKKQSSKTNTLTNEQIVFFQKLPDSDAYFYLNETNYEFEITKIIYKQVVRAGAKGVSISAAVQDIVDNLLQVHNIVASPETIDRIKRIIQSNFNCVNGFVFLDENRLYLAIEDDNSLFVKLYNLVPLYIKKLLKQNNRFLLEDIYRELTTSLCDGNPKTIEQILTNDKHQKEIERLINNYCIIQDGYFVERKYETIPNENAIDISTLSGTDFELLTKKLLTAEGYEDVIVIGGSGDLGVDLVAKKNGNTCIFFFFCWNANVGSTPIQRLYTERSIHHYDKAYCITTSDYTEDGKKEAELCEVEIINGIQTIELLNKHFPGSYYNGAILIK